MEVFNKKTLDRQKQPAELSDDPADQPKQASKGLIDDQAAYPDEKAPRRNRVQCHPDRRTEHRREADHTVIAVVEQREAESEAGCPVEDIFEVDCKPAVPHQPPEQSDHIIRKRQKRTCGDRNQPEIPLLYNLSTHQPNRRVSSPSPFSPACSCQNRPGSPPCRPHPPRLSPD